MPQSLANIYVHLIFSTKDRHPFLTENIREELHSYMATTLKETGCHTVLINSMNNHIHILFNLGRTVSLAKAVEEAKKSSSKWLKTKSPLLTKFAWQAGYGAFSVSESNMPQVANYIRNQQEHHKTKSFKEEFTDFLTKHRINYDEKYIWD